MACGVLVPWPGIQQPKSPALEVQSPNHWTTRKVSLILVEGRKLSKCYLFFILLLLLLEKKTTKPMK